MEERADARSTWVGEADRYVARTMTAASDWLERHADERFFLVVDAWDPHEPCNPPAYHTRRYLPDYAGEEVQPPYAKWREFGLTQRDVDVAHATYCGEVTMVDTWVGRLLEKIELVGLREETISSSSFPTMATTSGSTTISGSPSGWRPRERRRGRRCTRR